MNMLLRLLIVKIQFRCRCTRSAFMWWAFHASLLALWTATQRCSGIRTASHCSSQYATYAGCGHVLLDYHSRDLRSQWTIEKALYLQCFFKAEVCILENVMGLAKYVQKIVALIQRNIHGYLDWWKPPHVHLSHPWARPMDQKFPLRYFTIVKYVTPTLDSNRESGRWKCSWAFLTSSALCNISQGMHLEPPLAESVSSSSWWEPMSWGKSSWIQMYFQALGMTQLTMWACAVNQMSNGNLSETVFMFLISCYGLSVRVGFTSLTFPCSFCSGHLFYCQTPMLLFLKISGNAGSCISRMLRSTLVKRGCHWMPGRDSIAVTSTRSL